MGTVPAEHGGRRLRSQAWWDDPGNPHPLQETGKRPTAALDRNLAYLGLVEVLYGYPLDGVVLTTGRDKTTPACLMAATRAAGRWTWSST